MNVVITVLLSTAVVINAEYVTREKIVKAAGSEIGKLIRYFLANRDLTIEDINQLGGILTQQTERKSKIIQEANDWARQHHVKPYFDKVTEDLRRYWRMEEAISKAFVDGLLTPKRDYESTINRMKEFEEEEKPEVVELLEQRHAVEKALLHLLRNEKYYQISESDVPTMRKEWIERALWDIPNLRKRLLEKAMYAPKLPREVLLLEDEPKTAKFAAKKIRRVH